MQQSTVSVPGQSDAHPPSSTEVLEFLPLHSRGKTQAVEKTGSSHLCLVSIQLLQTLIQLQQLLTLGCVGVKERHLLSINVATTQLYRIHFPFAVIAGYITLNSQSSWASLSASFSSIILCSSTSMTQYRAVFSLGAISRDKW